jgi:hypothetical protein
MMRHECDRCRREIETENEVWYAVRIEALPHANVLASDDDRDHLMEVVEELDAIESVEGGLVTDYAPLEATYDLCEECYEKYRKSPLGVEPATLGFSRN